MLQDQDLGSRVWDNCKTVHRLNYFRACPVLHKPRSGWSSWAQILPVLVQDNLGDSPAGNCDRTGQAPYLCRAVSFSVTNL